ncbi:MAG TPA: hypothetical protein VNH11_13005 [Pirellulales bacterium]|nr:hypothetical protein [Pirellulales bacterium]
MRAALDGTQRWLSTSEHGRAWRNYLGTDALRRELDEERPDLSVIRRSLRRLSSDASALSAQPLLELRSGLQGWLAWECLPADRQLVSVADSILRRPHARARPAARLVSHKTDAAHKHELRARLTALLALLPRYADRPTEELAEAIDMHLRWLDDASDARPLVAAIRQYYSHPNVWIDISEEYLEQSVIQSIDRWEHVQSVILGTPVSGRGRLRAASDLVIEPYADQARLRIVVRGTLDTETIGRAGPARISARALTSFRAEKPLLLSGAGLKVLPAVCVAETRTLASNVAAFRRGLAAGLVRRVALRRWQAVREASERDSARQAETQLKAALDRESDALIKRLDRVALAPVLAMVGGHAARTRIRFCSETRMLRIGAVYGPLGAPPGRPRHEQNRAFTLQVHSALVDRLKNSVAASPCSMIGVQQCEALAWNWIEKTLSPRLTPGGVTLRDGEWGTLVPVGLVGDWMAVQWRAGAPQPRLAKAARLRVK